MSSAALVAEPFFLNDMVTTRRIKTFHLLWCFRNTNATAENLRHVAKRTLRSRAPSDPVPGTYPQMLTVQWIRLLPRNRCEFVVNCPSVPPLIHGTLPEGSRPTVPPPSRGDSGQASRRPDLTDSL
jgi:hypothetical protein